MGRSAKAIIERKKTAANLRKLRRSNGFCIFCGRPAEPGRVRCKDHLDRDALVGQKYRKSEKGGIAQKAYRRGPGRFHAISDLARRQGKDWTLSEETWRTFVAQPCFYCGVVTGIEVGAGLDRLNNADGYVPGNVVSCCRECNTARSNNFSPEEMKVIGLAVREVKLKRMK